MKYITGLKYQLVEDEVYFTGITGYNIRFRFSILDETGKLTLLAGFACDGVSGPTLDFIWKKALKAAFAHDALYELMRQGLISQEERVKADEFFGLGCVGMYKWRVSLALAILKKAGASNADPKNKRTIHTV